MTNVKADANGVKTKKRRANASSSASASVTTSGILRKGRSKRRFYNSSGFVAFICTLSCLCAVVTVVTYANKTGKFELPVDFSKFLQASWGFAGSSNESDLDGNSMLLQQYGDDPSVAILLNPEMSWYDAYFCTGYRRSTNCVARPLHPFIDYMEHAFDMDFYAWAKKDNKRLPVEQRPGTTQQKTSPGITVLTRGDRDIFSVGQ